MDSKKAQEELAKIGKGNYVFLEGTIDFPNGDTNRYEKLIDFDEASVTVERPTSRDFRGNIESEVIYYSKISMILKERPKPITLTPWRNGMHDL